MLYYDAKNEKRHNRQTLARAGLTPQSKNVYPLTNNLPDYDHQTQIVEDAGTGGNTTQGFYVDYVVKEAQPSWEIVRHRRNRLLDESDWTDLPHAPLDKETVAKWVTYRQALRDLPSTTEDPADVKWPQPPMGKF